MTPDFTLPAYGVGAFWSARREAPSVIAGKFQRYLETLRTIDPMLDQWRFATAKGWRNYTGHLASVEQFVTESVCKDDCGEPEGEFGYTVSASTQIDGPRGFHIHGGAGGWIPLPFTNSVGFGNAMGFRPDRDCTRYELFKAVLLATVSTWSPFVCNAYHTPLLRSVDQSADVFGKAWIQYVPPYLAADVTPGDVPIVETAPDGGLLLIATRDVFDSDDPAHIAAAEAIDRATAHLAWSDERLVERQ